ncbi:MAG TPA: hypothetical protein VFP58_14985 [Candidatus Eisenbacteria bacterium]|nr:hypothetical protein [Candidatus Eisenbacteria bacterium]
MAKKRRLSIPGIAVVMPFAARALKFLVKSQLFTVLLVLCALGYWAGTQARPDPQSIPYEDLFENMSVVSYRDSPSDTMPKFVVELAARGTMFRQYDVDSRRFLEPLRGRDYRRSISGSRYEPLHVRGHVARGFWFELPTTPSRPAHGDQFEELYRSTLDYLKPVSVTAAVLGALSGYSTGYRMAVWSGSLANPKVQERVIASPAFSREVAREAWRRVLLEPVVVGHEADVVRFAEIRGTQRVYTNFFRLALNDSDRFIPREVARLDSMGLHRESRAMRSFASAVSRAAQDTCDLTSEDFRAVEEWASLLARDGHWARRGIPLDAEDRMRYLGTLAWYGVAPATGHEQRIWIGPRILVRVGEDEGFVADEIPLHPAGSPVAWREWLRDDSMTLSSNAWTAQWMGDLKQFTPLVHAGRNIARAVARSGGGSGGTRAREAPQVVASRREAATAGAAPTAVRAGLGANRTDPYAVGRGAFSVAPHPATPPLLHTAPSVPATVADSLLPGFDMSAPFADSTGARADSSGTASGWSSVKGEAVGVAAEP